MDTERTPEGSEQPSDNSDKTNKHWAEWEIGCLLSQFRDCMSINDTARALHRTEAACKRMLARLLDGETPCPKQYKTLLEEVREKFPPEPKRRTNTKADAEQLRQQYLSLAKNQEAIRSLLDEVETLQVYSLPLDLLDGRITSDEIAHLCPISMFRTVVGAFKKIQLYRKDHPDLFNKPQPDETGRTLSGCRPPPGNPHPQSVIADPETGPPAPTEDKA